LGCKNTTNNYRLKRLRGLKGLKEILKLSSWTGRVVDKNEFAFNCRRLQSAETREDDALI